MKHAAEYNTFLPNDLNTEKKLLNFQDTVCKVSFLNKSITSNIGLRYTHICAMYVCSMCIQSL